MTPRAVIAMALAFAFPGAGHVFLGRRGRGLAYCAIVVFLFIVGLAVGGELYWVGDADGRVLRVFASLASMGNGLLYFLGRAFGPHGAITGATYEYGTTFPLTAGLMNLLLVLDCYDIANGRKA